ncbi:MAG: hypothetical protein V4712_14925 [Pseudomonadota bacterium]
MAPFCLLAGLAIIGACATFPELDRLPDAPTADLPRLLPLDQLLAQANAAPRATEAAAEGLAGRAARLRNRAALMRGPVHDPATRARLSAAIEAGRA